MRANRATPSERQVARSEYPRPQLVRGEWMCLNGAWEFAFDRDDTGIERQFFNREDFSDRITVPFAYQTELSGIDSREVCEVVWYGRSFDIPPGWRERTVLLHFGAVDYEASVWVNGVQAGFHRGGYTPFTFDITGLVRDGENRLSVRVVDSQDPEQPRGKQSSTGQPHGIDYWCTTGIWQSVWLEPVPRSYVADVQITSRSPDGELRITPVIHGDRAGIEVNACLYNGDLTVCEAGVADSVLGSPIVMRLAAPRLWSPEDPHLYELRIKLLRQNEVIDAVASYVGLRSIEVRDRAIWLNGARIYLKMVLDQGYWPESGLTAPSDQALEDDVLWVKKLGFNAVRKHQKVEDPRWLYWCDRHGLLVWGEMANARTWSLEGQEQLEREWSLAVERDRNHPCIIAWVPLNESMGFQNLVEDSRQRAGVEGLVHLTRKLDPTRLVVDNDGWEQTAATDIIAIHDYSHSGAALAERYAKFAEGGELPDRIWSGSRTSLLAGAGTNGKPIMLTEVGGFLTIPPSCEALDVMYQIYNSVRDSDELLERYRELMNAIGSLPFLSGFCYTQLTDVEQELNGLLTYRRKPKVDAEQIAEIHARMFANPRRATADEPAHLLAIQGE